eukprot:11154408-Alexandrium_andersonii.AAC.1
MSDIRETVHVEDVFDDIDAEMDYLMGLLEGASQERQSGWCELAGSVPAGTPDLIRAPFAAGATPGEARASVAE